MRYWHSGSSALAIVATFGALLPIEAGMATSDPNQAPAPGAPIAADPTAPSPIDPGSFEPAGPATPDGFRFKGAVASLWTAAAAGQIGLRAYNTIPYLFPPEELFEPDLYVWDAWPLRLKDGQVAEIDGWMVLIALSSLRDPNAKWPFYTRSEWRYWYGRDGEWRLGGKVFDRQTALGSRQWAGSAVYDDANNRAYFYYTAVGTPDAEGLEDDQPALAYPPGHPAAGRPSIVQRMAVVNAAVSAGDQGIAFDDFSEHEIIFEADGKFYQTHEQSEADQVIYGMRDPWYYQDPDTGKEHILFTANAAFAPGTHNGVVGLASRDGDGSWQLQPPLVAALGVSSQLERPHIVHRGDTRYLFFSTHAFTFADGLSGPEGLYGFVNRTGRLDGHYEPLNGSGLVAGNPNVAPTMVYSYLVLPDGQVTSYINTAAGYGSGTAPVNNEVGKFYGGPAPTFQIGLDGPNTRIIAAPDNGR